MQCVLDRYPALFSPAKSTMQLFMWQRDIECGVFCAQHWQACLMTCICMHLVSYAC